MAKGIAEATGTAQRRGQSRRRLLAGSGDAPGRGAGWRRAPSGAKGDRGPAAPPGGRSPS